MLGIFLDIESNGLNCYKHRTLEIALKIIELETGDEYGEIQSIIAQPYEIWEKSDLESLKVNGFTWDMVTTGKPEKEIKEKIVELFKKANIDRKNAVFICQNPSFDRAFFSQIVEPDLQEILKWPYHWLDLASMFWGSFMEKGKQETLPFPWEVGFSKDKIAQFFSLPLETKPHRAMNGVEHLILCYRNIVGFPFSISVDTVND